MREFDYGILVSIIGMILGLLLYYLDLKKNINRLVNRDLTGILTYTQAKNLSYIYLESIKNKLYLLLERFFTDNRLTSSITNNDHEGIRKFISHSWYELAEYRRRQLAPFRIAGGKTFECFIEEIDHSIANSTLEKVINEVINISNNQTDIVIHKNKIRDIIEEGNQKAKHLFDIELSKYYTSLMPSPYYDESICLKLIKYYRMYKEVKYKENQLNTKMKADD